MRIYFLSERTAGLKLNGAYLGLIDGFERFVETDDDPKILAEAVPDGDALPLSLIIDGKFFKDPPDFTDVYMTDGDAVIYLSRYEPREKKLEVVAQARLGGLLVTLFINGGRVYLNCEGDECALYELGGGFEKARLKEDRINGFPVLLVEGNERLAVISESGKRVFFNPAESWETGDKLTVTVKFNTCAACKAVCTFGYDGEKMTAEKSVTREYVPPNADILHFAFFESVLTHGDFGKYLSDDLKEKADALPSFLGEFVDVTVPYKKFYDRHGDIKAAGLVYPVSKNLFDVKYFAVDIEGGKITNIYEVQA